MSKAAAIPLLSAIVVGVAVVAAIGLRPSVADPPSPGEPIRAFPVGSYISHDWYEPPPRESRRALIPAGQNTAVACTLPNCRNCQIHATWRQSL